MAKSILIPSFAKINLFLDIICKRPDGYHNIETVFQTIDLHDDVSLELRPSGLKIECDDPSVPSDSSNLAAKAFSALRPALNYEGGVRITLRKRIPPGSGLGGGSSNAAAVLKGLKCLFQEQVSEQFLMETARQLGADVPFFLFGGLAAGWGKGERLERISPLPASFLVVAVPAGVSVSTALAYGKVRAPQCAGPPPAELSGCSESLKTFLKALDPSLPLSANASAIQLLYNELEEPALGMFPEIGRLKNRMLEAGAKAALMTGSGSAVFGIADSLSHAQRIRSKLEASCPCRGFTVSTINGR
ncbi:MAG: 4-(cytidine 5'-diphospho)-2-C-methyl-D-erythritol kinase [Candidatus Abyssobacteria bacterium SURF_5]|uniref:4-diphosphocytidyl-2-C-methyl-D-erythritol kinase n=1 Tax=Abyssobacteria bacterium (strain SURF_5) TaxID=2093360 RepID=A0A3A4N5J2_ABYX5|nr:MAG: 4-(cytidine 5'-diphospho)-2-C-methyl-D-erythritol kinase [Candidatus Abyssubacteria bacterium SURF_5]